MNRLAEVRQIPRTAAGLRVRFVSFRSGARSPLARHIGGAVARAVGTLLDLLIHANGNVIDKATIASRVWPEKAVSDGNLSQHMYMLRQLLDERARDRAYVMTVRGRGYRFVAPVSVVAPVPAPELAGAPDRPRRSALAGAPEALHHYCRGAYPPREANRDRARGGGRTVPGRAARRSRLRARR